MESAIKEDCVGDPPGEFIINATAGLFLSENNLSINLLIPWSERPERKIPAWPITPDNLRVGIVTDLLKKNIITLIKTYFKEEEFIFHIC